MNRSFAISLSFTLYSVFSVQSVSAELPAAVTFEMQRISSISIEPQNLPPDRVFDENDVLKKMETKKGEPFSQVAFDHDLKMLSLEYDKIEPQLEAEKGNLSLIIKVWLPPFIREIIWKGNHYISSKTLTDQFKLRPGKPLQKVALNKGFDSVKEYYMKKGYFEAQLGYRLVYNEQRDAVDIEVDIQEGRPGIIDEILFEGFTQDEKSKLLDMIYTKKHRLLTSWFTGHGRFNEEAIEQDKLTIIDFLQNAGYADAKVAIRIEDSATPGKIKVILIGCRGPQYHFNEITFTGNTIFPNNEVEEKFSVRPGGEYSPQKLRDTAEALKELYGRKGYIDTLVDYELQLVDDQFLYNAHFTIEEGMPYKIGVIHIHGNQHTATAVILRESLLIPGEVFDAAKLKATQKKLENMNYFSKVNVYAVRDSSHDERSRDVHIDIEERTTGNVSVFAGFSTADNVFGGIELSESNFNYAGLNKVFKRGPSALRGGGEYLQLRANFGSKQSSYSLSWMTPSLRETPWRFGFDTTITSSTVVSDDIRIETYGGSLFVNYPVTNLWTFGTRYRIRNAHNKLLKNKENVLTPDEKREIFRDGLISAISASMNFDSTNSIVKPHRGLRSYIEGEYAGVGGDFYFTKFSYLNTLYMLLWPHGIIKYRFDLRSIWPIFSTSRPDQIPLSERFYLGGEGSVRGYKLFDLGNHFSNGDARGGLTSNVCSVEYLHELLPVLDAFLFVDAGSLSMKPARLRTFRMSWGGGVRVEVMNRMPMIIGMGFPANPGSHEEVQRFFFSMGGQF